MSYVSPDTVASFDMSFLNEYSVNRQLNVNPNIIFSMELEHEIQIRI